MRLAIGLTLVALSLFGGYMILTGRFPPSSVNTTPATTASGSAAGSGNSTGSGGVSLVGRITHLGIPTLSRWSGDFQGSAGGYV